MKKLLIGTGAVTVSLWVLAHVSTMVMDRRMDATPLIERVTAITLPDEFVPIDEWAHDGDWLFKPRPPVAARLYLTAGPVEAACARLEGHLQAAGQALRRQSRSPQVEAWCGLAVIGTDVSITVQETLRVPPVGWSGRDPVEVLVTAQR